MPVKHKTLPSHEYLQQCFDYDPDSGVIRWQTRPRSHFDSESAYGKHYFYFAGREITHVDPHGYLNLTLDGVHYRAARVIWKLVTWEEPPEIVDHADRDRLNNRWSNLRAATSAQNLRNGKSRPNTSGYRGVSKYGNKWKAQIHRDGISRHLGIFKTAKEAATAYENAAREADGEFYYRRANFLKLRGQNFKNPK